jgi:hypothetical protein
MKGKIFAAMAAFCLVANLISVGEAQTPNKNDEPKVVRALDLTNVGDGQYVLTVDGAVITLAPLVLVQPNVPDPPDPPDPELNERAKKFKAAAASVKDSGPGPHDPKKQETQAVLSALYNQLSQAILDNGLTDYQLIATLVKTAEKQVLDRQDAVAAWTPVTSLMSDELAKVAATSDTTAADFAACLTDAADGLENGQNLDPIWIELIIQIIKMILELINP